MENEKLSKAKTRLIIHAPFFASLLLSMEFRETKDVQTFATDGASILYNEKFLETLSVPETTFVLAHEVLHCAFQHMFRLGEKDASKWNKATDYIINDLLSKETNIGTMPKGGLLDASIVAKGKGTAEGVYNILPDEPKGNGKGKKPGPEGFDELRQPEGDESTLSQKESEMKVKVAQARNAAKMRGTLSEGIDRLVEESLKTKVDWKAALRRFLSEKSKTEFSYAKPKRRFLGEDLYLPSLIGEKLGAVVVAVDCSGSINEKILGEFEREIQAILEDTRPSEIKIVYFDSEVLKTETFTEENTVKLSPVGGGGTAFSPIFQSIESYETAPVAVVVLTDLYCDDFGPTPDYPVLWATTEKIRPKQEIPFGETLYIGKGEK